MSRLSLTVLLLVLAALGLSACGGDESSDSTAASAPTPETTEIGCEQVAEPQPKGDQDLAPPDEKLDPGRTYVATVKTTCGEFDITLDVERAPKTTASFAHLVEQDFYDGLTFHRISPGFVIQGGDPLGDGTGGPGYSVHEAPPQSLSYDKGVVAMAKAGDEAPGTSGSQFFVVTEDASLTADYSLLGEVTRGMDVVEKISAAAIDNFEKPTEPIVIRDITMKRPQT